MSPVDVAASFAGCVLGCDRPYVQYAADMSISDLVLPLTAGASCELPPFVTDPSASRPAALTVKLETVPTPPPVDEDAHVPFPGMEDLEIDLDADSPESGLLPAGRTPTMCVGLRRCLRTPRLSLRLPRPGCATSSPGSPASGDLAVPLPTLRSVLPAPAPGPPGRRHRPQTGTSFGDPC